MTKLEFSAAMAEDLNIPRRDAEAIYDVLFKKSGLIAMAIRTNGELKLGDLGTFKVKAQAARIARNPATGEPLAIPAQNVVRFSVGKLLKDLIK